MFVSQIIDEASEILATTDQTKVFRKLTQALQVLMESGHYFHTNAEVDVCTGWDGQTITLPRGIEVPLAVNIDGSPTYFRNRLFQYHVNKGGMYNPVDWAWDDRGFVATTMDIRQPSQLVAIAEHQSDVGKTIRITGTDGNNRQLRSVATDGTPVDGLILPIHSQNDFPFGTIQADGVTINTRSASVNPITEFSATSAHQFVSGTSANLLLNSGVLPTGLSAGAQYYIGVVDSLTVQLYQNALDAINNNNQIQLQNIVGATTGGLTLLDSRAVQLLTAINLRNNVPFSITSPNEVTFSVGSGTGFANTLPTPLIATQTYFAQQLDSSNLQIYGSLSDATNQNNPVLLTGNSGLFNVDVRKAMSPQTKLTFAVAHYFSTGDQVQALTAGGTLPAPLIQGQNYFVYVLDTFNVTIHTNAADAATGSNPISFQSSGSGQNSLVKLIPASVNAGSTNNIAFSPSSFNLQSPTGSGASAFAVSVGSVTSVTLNAAGSNYSSAPSVTFSSPQTPPANSNQQTRAASGYATMVGTGSTQTVGSVVITDGGLGYVNPPTITFSGGGGSGATATANLTKSFVSYFNIISGGNGYTTAPQIQVTGGGGTGATAVSTVANGQITSISVVTAGTGYTSNPSVTITPSTGVFVQFTSTGTLPTPLVSGTAYRAESPLNTTNGTFTVKDASFNSITITDNGSGAFYLQLSRTFSVGFTNEWVGDFSGLTAGQQLYFSSDYLFPTINSSLGYGYIAPISKTLAKFYTTSAQATAGFPLAGTITITNGGSGYTQNPIVTISGGGGTGATAAASITSGITSYTILNGGSGYTYPPSVNFSDPSGSGASAVSIITGGVLTGIQIQSYGTTYTAPSATFGTSWYASNPLLLNNQIYYGNNLYTVTVGGISGTTAPTFTSGSQTNGTATLTYAGTVPSVQLSISYSVSSITIYNKGANYYTMPAITISAAVGDTTGSGATAVANDNAIVVQSLGSGQPYYSYRVSAYAKAYIPADNSTSGASLIVPSSTQNLTTGTLVSFKTSAYSNGTDTGLPYPLTTGTLYQVQTYGDNIWLKDSTGTNPIVFANTNIPTLVTGTMVMNHSVAFTPVASTSLNVPNSVYETGMQVMVRPNDNDTLPSGLLIESNSSVNPYVDAFVNGNINIFYNTTAYYVRFIDAETISLYDTQKHAVSGGSTGLVNYLSTGSAASSTFFIDSILAPTLVKSVSHVLKPQTVGYVSLYALDYGRSNDMALIGQYHPNELNPQYRRIRIGQSCAWARIIYRVSRPDITSVYDYIPLENTRAILCALHAIDLEDKDFIEQAQKYMGLAIAYLHSQNESMEGHAMMPPQINNITYGDYTDPVIDSDFYGTY